MNRGRGLSVGTSGTSTKGESEEEFPTRRGEVSRRVEAGKDEEAKRNKEKEDESASHRPGGGDGAVTVVEAGRRNAGHRVENETNLRVCMWRGKEACIWKRARGQADKGRQASSEQAASKQADACHLAQRKTRSQPRHVSNSRDDGSRSAASPKPRRRRRAWKTFFRLSRERLREIGVSFISPSSCSSFSLRRDDLSFLSSSFSLSLSLPSERTNERLEHALVE